MIGRIVRSADFERVLRTRSQVSSAHFALHHLADVPSRPAKPAKTAPAPELSTGAAPNVGEPVDDFGLNDRAAPASTVFADSPAPRVWLGAVVPKRHARRSVTRSLLKRQIRSAIDRQAVALTGGLWVVRLRAPFDRKVFPSASSSALQTAARTELDQLLVQWLVRQSSAVTRTVR